MCNSVLIFVRNRHEMRGARAATMRVDARRSVASKRQCRTTHRVLLHIDVGKSQSPLTANRFEHRLFHGPSRRGESRGCARRRGRSHHCYFALVKCSSHESFAVSIQQPLDASHSHKVAPHAKNCTATKKNKKQKTFDLTLENL